MTDQTTSTFTANGQASAEINSMQAPFLTVSISGTWTGTIEIQRSFDAGANWKTVESYTANQEKDIRQASRQMIWRLATTAAWTGTATYFLGGERMS